ncbi:MAG: sodium-dependent transporter, partial [Candidatus Hydrogenedentota bacterium]
ILLKPQVWMAAYSQIFFTLSLGFGIMIAYASYLPRDSDISVNATITGIVNCGFSFLAGLAVFSTLGYMAYTTGKPFHEVVESGIGLAFVAYPEAIAKMPVLPSVIGLAFFLLLILAGLSSSISILEAFASSVMDKYAIRRRRTITLLCILGFLGSVIFTTRSGIVWLDIVDHFLTRYGLVVVGLLECIVIGWIYGSHRLREHVNRTSNFSVSRGWEFCVRILTPIILCVILVSSIYNDLLKSYGGYSRTSVLVIGFGWLAATVAVALIFKRSLWRDVEIGNEKAIDVD